MCALAVLVIALATSLVSTTNVALLTQDGNERSKVSESLRQSDEGKRIGYFFDDLMSASHEDVLNMYNASVTTDANSYLEQGKDKDQAGMAPQRGRGEKGRRDQAAAKKAKANFEEICQHKQEVLNCPFGDTIKVASAIVKCCGAVCVAGQTCQRKGGKDDDRTEFVKLQCDGKPSCKLGLWNTIGRFVASIPNTINGGIDIRNEDVCQGSFKKATVTYSCQKAACDEVKKNPVDLARKYSDFWSRLPSRGNKGFIYKDSKLDSTTSWCAAKTNYLNGKWMQIDLGASYTIRGVVTQGRPDTTLNHWVTLYKVEVRGSSDGSKWQTLAGEFQGNKDKTSQVTRRFEKPVTAQYVRILVKSFNGFPCMRAGVVVCDKAQPTIQATPASTLNPQAATAPQPAPAPKPPNEALYPMNVKVYIQGHGNKYLREDKYKQGEVKLAINKGAWEKWTISGNGNGQVILTSRRNEHLQDAHGSVKLHENAQHWETWTISNAGNGQVYLKSHRDKYLQAHTSGVKLVQFNRNLEKWRIVPVEAALCPMDTPVFIRSHRDENLQDSVLGRVKLTKSTGSWEEWKISANNGKVVLATPKRKYFRRKYLQDNNGQVKLNHPWNSGQSASSQLPSEQWTISLAGDGKVFLKSHRNHYLQDSSDNVKLTTNTRNWEKWLIIPAQATTGCLRGFVFLTSDKNRQLEKRNGKVGLMPDKGDYQQWTIFATSGGVFITKPEPYKNQQLEDRGGKIGLHNDKGKYQTWKIKDAGHGKVFITSHRGAWLEDRSNKVSLRWWTRFLGKREKWTITTMSGSRCSADSFKATTEESCVDDLDVAGAAKPWSDFASCAQEKIQNACFSNAVVKLGCKKTCGLCPKAARGKARLLEVSPNENTLSVTPSLSTDNEESSQVERSAKHALMRKQSKQGAKTMRLTVDDRGEVSSLASLTQEDEISNSVDVSNVLTSAIRNVDIGSVL